MRRAGYVIIAGFLLTSCMTNPETAPQIARPSTPIQKAKTNFSEALSCMDDLLFAYGKRGFKITASNLPDHTSSVTAGTRDMIVTALQRMSRKSRAFRFFDSAPNGDGHLIHARFKFDAQLATVPTYYISGSVTVADRGVARDSVQAGLGLPQVRIGASADQSLTFVSIDMWVADVKSTEALNDVSTSNTIVVRNRGKGADAEGIINQGAIFVDISHNRSEGAGQAVRTLIELGAIELAGKLTRVPYSRCLEAPSTDPKTVTVVREWYDALTAKERIQVVQTGLVSQGAFAGPADGAATPAFREALSRYKAAHSLVPNGRVDFGVYYQLVTDNAPIAPQDIHDNRVASGDRSRADYTVKYDGSGVSDRPSGSSYAGLALEMVGGPKRNVFVGAPLSFKATVEKPAVVYCYYEFVEGGARQVARIYPNRFQKATMLQPGETLVIPSADAPFKLAATSSSVDEKVACIAKEGGYTVDQAPKLLFLPDLAPIPNVQYLDTVISFHQTADHQGTAVQTVSWLVR